MSFSASPVPPATGAVFQPLRPEDPRRLGEYVLRARLGGGGMGQVFLAESPAGRRLALKVIRPELAGDREFRHRFAREVAAARKVSGPYTAVVADADVTGPQPWLATAYVQGVTVQDAVDRHGPLPVETVMTLAAGIAEALRHIHRAQVVHRDLKPSNVVLTADGPIVIDFGIAQAVNATAVTRAGDLIGSVAYMAPEQVLGEGAQPATDLFALGSLLVHAATGAPAFGDTGVVTALHRIVAEPPRLERCPEPVRAVAAALLEKDPAARPTPERVIEMCRPAHAATRPLSSPAWLPPTLVADLVTRTAEAIPAPVPAPAPGSSAPDVPAHPMPGPTLVLDDGRPRHKFLAVSATVVAAAAVAGAAYGMTNGGSDHGGQSGQVAVTRPTTDAGSATPSSASPLPVTNPAGAASPASAGDSTPASSSTPSKSTEGQLVSQKKYQVPDQYCLNLITGGLTQSFLNDPCNDADTMYFSFYGAPSENGIWHAQSVLLESSETADFATCSATTRFADMFSELKVSPGSVLCWHSRERGVVGTVRIDSLPSTKKSSLYWDVTVTTWKGSMAG